MRERISSAWRVSERAKLYSAGSGQDSVGRGRWAVGRKLARHLGRAALVSVAISFSACARDRVTPVYDSAGTIKRIDYDTDRDGHVDMRAYLENGKTVRIEADGNADGIVDRWEYYRADGQLDRLGTSSGSDGVEDMWVVQQGDQMRVDIATRRDGIADRHEFHDKGVLVRAEQDTNGDGRLDQWQRFDGGKLRELLVDTSRASGRPDTRLVYAGDGSLQRVDSDIAPQ